MRTFRFSASCVSVFVCLVCVTSAQAAGTDASVQPGGSLAATDAPADSIQAAATRWAKELDRLADALEERALYEEGDDAEIQALLTRADHLKVQRAQLQECGAGRRQEIAFALRRSVEDTPEASPVERDSVMALIRRLGVSPARGPQPAHAPGAIR